MIGTKAQIVEYLKTLPNDETKYEIDKHREKRSKDSNSLFHVLCDRLRVKLGTSMPYMKNLLVSKYGVALYADDGSPLIYKTNAPPEFMMEIERPHTSCFRETEEGGRQVYWYRLYGNTAEYDSRDMSILINGTVEDCKEQGIETASPEEIARLNELWRQKHG